jgi:DNA primase
MSGIDIHGDEVRASGVTVKLSNTGKVLFPADAITKGELIAAAYSIRARPGAHVATPLHWQEAADPGLTPARFTLRTLGERLAGTPDPWAGMSRHRYDIATARRRLARLAAG